MPTDPVLKPRACAPDDVAVDAPEPPLVDRSEAVDEEVVADVVPAVALDVEELDPLHDRGCLGARVAVLTGRVVDDREAHVARVARRAAPDLLVRTPRPSRHDRGRRGRARDAKRDERLRAPDEMRANPRHVAESARLEPVRLADPPRVADPPAAPCGVPGSPRRDRPRPRGHPDATGSRHRRAIACGS